MVYICLKLTFPNLKPRIRDWTHSTMVTLKIANIPATVSPSPQLWADRNTRLLGDKLEGPRLCPPSFSIHSHHPQKWLHLPRETVDVGWMKHETWDMEESQPSGAPSIWRKEAWDEESLDPHYHTDSPLKIEGFYFPPKENTPISLYLSKYIISGSCTVLSIKCGEL